MFIRNLMSPQVHSCRSEETLDVAARSMWEHDCGALPIVDAKGDPVGMLTDRDICMAAYTQGKGLRDIRVAVAGSFPAYSVSADGPVRWAYAVMKLHRVRRLQVVDLGGNLVGVLSLADIARRARHEVDPVDELDVEALASTLVEVYRPHRCSNGAPVGRSPSCVAQVMTREVRTCRPEDSLGHAAQIMWEADCGCVPVVDPEGKPRAMLTDRDVCMAAYTRGVALGQMDVAGAASHRLVTVRESDALATAEQLMREYKIRRLPVVDASGKLAGILSMNDLVRRGYGPGHSHAVSAEGIVKTLAAVCEPPRASA
ncbi:MAG: CBS domain-containing protein [Polyangiaceae bacterium]